LRMKLMETVIVITCHGSNTEIGEIL